MARANAAYYATRDPYRDFATAPEITQVFGELLGAWAAVTWQSMGAPDGVLLAEMGPGRGTLMADALRAIEQTMPAFRAAMRLHLVETSPRLRAVQAQKLCQGKLGQATWHESAAELPDRPLLLLANEFLDALPVRQFVRRTDGWSERHVQGGRFVELPASPPPTGAVAEAASGQVVELCELACRLATEVARRLVASGGAALFIDYGPARSAPGDSLQALHNGQPADPLAEPGSRDLTAHVDFQALAEAAARAGAACHGPLPLGLFLARLGLFQRTDAIARAQPPARAAALIESARRLAEPDQMGRLCKALSICHPALPPPPGFAE